jgi:hypothetical protein
MPLIAGEQVPWIGYLSLLKLARLVHNDSHLYSATQSQQQFNFTDFPGASPQVREDCADGVGDCQQKCSSQQDNSC